ncbi:MAG: hypothetical protein KF730_00540 [Sphingomonas sp.]|uniref:hypothetical protein n=1 Tax=Sphingomonas sp. TaxID=28214 RepID=UPI0025F0F6A4|nr:hypothetical protein [Sphingomonas sp.]MBX3563039.1 hypothetical protein [Sphingomonas sp.]
MNSKDLARILEEASNKLAENGIDPAFIDDLRHDALLNEVVGKWPPDIEHLPSAPELKIQADQLAVAGAELAKAGEVDIALQLTGLAGQVSMAAGIIGKWPKGSADR